MFVKPGKNLDRLRDMDILVYSRYYGRITMGVGREINMALGLKKRVYEATDSGFVRVEGPVQYLNQAETNSLYRKRAALEKMLNGTG